MTCFTLKEWLNVQGTLTSVELGVLENVCFDLEKDGRYWNTEELKFNFIAFVFYLAKINVRDKIKVFYEMPISGKVENINISVKVDVVIVQRQDFQFIKNQFLFHL